MGKKSTFQFEVAVRVGLNIETLNLILKPQSAVFLGENISVVTGFQGPNIEAFYGQC